MQQEALPCVKQVAETKQGLITALTGEIVIAQGWKPSLQFSVKHKLLMKTTANYTGKNNCVTKAQLRTRDNFVC